MNILSKDVMAKASSMGIEVKTHMSTISDIDAIAVKNALIHRDKGVETKIVKVAAKTEQSKPSPEDVPRVVVKAAVKPAANPARSRPPIPAAGAKPENRPTQRPPQGVPRRVVETLSVDMVRIPAEKAGGMNENDAERKVSDGRTVSDDVAIKSVPVRSTDDALIPTDASEPAEGHKTYAASSPGKSHASEETERKTETRAPVPVRAEKTDVSAPVQNHGENSRIAARDTAEHKPGADNRPAGQGYDNRPARPGTDNRPAGQGYDNRPARPGADNRPARQGSDNRPARPGADNRPARQGYDNRPARPGADNRPARQGYDNRPARPGADNRPARPGYDNRPARPGYDNRPARPGADNRPARPGADNRPARPGADNRPARPGADNRPARPGTDNRPARPGADNRPARPGTDNRPARPGGTTAGYNKSAAQKKKDGKPDVRKAAEKERDKYSGLKKKEVYPERSLEKAPLKTKSRPRPVQRQARSSAEPAVSLAPGTILINVPITVAGFAEQVEKSSSEVIMRLMRLGVMANINQNIDEDTVLVLAEELGVSVVIGNVDGEFTEKGLEQFDDREEDLEVRPPIITVMGHVDHGKTSLLDAIRKTNVTQGEAGGITQHIGASEVTINGRRIVFLDTPGHEAFTAMRARGAHVTDIAVLVVAADDGVKPQTIESISHAKAAGVPIIVAINKIDKPGANSDKAKQELSDNGVLVEEWGGDTICVPVSAKTGEGIVSLLEMILLQADVLELRANPNRLALGTVIEARLDKAKGPVATLLVLNGALEPGLSIVAGTSSGRIRAMTDFQGNTIKSAGPATAVEILGLTDVPEAGDEFNAVKDDRVARDIAENRRIRLRQEVMVKNSSTTLEKLFSRIQEGETKELSLIVKGDVQGSVGAVTASLEKLKNENVTVKLAHTGVGTVTESDVMLASTVGAIIIAFNVRPSTTVTNLADRESVEIRTYRVIYEIIEDVEAAMKGMLDPVFREVVLGKAVIRNTFKVPGIGVVAGAYITDGKMQRNADIRLVRDGIVVHEGKISSLKRFKDDAKEVAQGYECGIGIENFNDVKEGDEIEAFTMEETERA
jgi:translation initiation factor IF-2